MNSRAKMDKSLRDSLPNCGTALQSPDSPPLGALFVEMQPISPDSFGSPAEDTRLSPLPNSVSPARLGSEISREQPVVDQVHARLDDHQENTRRHAAGIPDELPYRGDRPLACQRTSPRHEDGRRARIDR